MRSTNSGHTVRHGSGPNPAVPAGLVVSAAPYRLLPRGSRSAQAEPISGVPVSPMEATR